MRIAAAVVLLFGFPAVTAAQTSAVPFATDGRGAIVITAQVGEGGPLTLLLDTGSTRSVVTASSARRLEAPVVAKTEVVTSAGSEWRKVVRLTDVAVGTAHAPMLLAAVLPDEALRAAGIRIDGILGQDFLRSRAYLIDYDRKTLTWDPPPQSRGTRLRLLPREGRYLVALPQQLDGSEALLFVADSGSDAVVLFEDAGGTPVMTRSRVAQAELVSLSGRRSVRKVTIPHLRVGAEVLRNQPAVVVFREDAGADGLLSLALFRRVLVDGENELMTVWR